MTLLAAVTAGVLGNLVGSWVAYFMGLWGGRELWFRYGKYVGVRAHHLDIAEKWFDRYGEFTVFVSRCLPVVRTFISFPAGTARMNFAKFSHLHLARLHPVGLRAHILRVRARGELGEDRGLSPLPRLRGGGGVLRRGRLPPLALALLAGLEGLRVGVERAVGEDAGPTRWAGWRSPALSGRPSSSTTSTSTGRPPRCVRTVFVPEGSPGAGAPGLPTRASPSPSWPGPSGAVVFGHFGDRVGRKTMLIISLL